MKYMILSFSFVSTMQAMDAVDALARARHCVYAGAHKEARDFLNQALETARSNQTRIDALFMLADLSAQQKNDRDSQGYYKKIMPMCAAQSDDYKRAQRAYEQLKYGPIIDLCCESSAVSVPVKVDTLLQVLKLARSNDIKNRAKLVLVRCYIDVPEMFIMTFSQAYAYLQEVLATAHGPEKLSAHLNMGRLLAKQDHPEAFEHFQLLADRRDLPLKIQQEVKAELAKRKV